MKTHRSVSTARTERAGAEGHRNVLTNGGGNCRRPQRYRYRVHPPVPKDERFGRMESACIALAASCWGTICTAPLWWEYDALAVMGCTVGAASALYAAIRISAVVPGMIRKLRESVRRREETKKLPVPLICVRGNRKPNCYRGYIPREVIGEAARRAAR